MSENVMPSIREGPENEWVELPKVMQDAVRLSVGERDWIKVEIESEIEYNRRIKQFGRKNADLWVARLTTDLQYSARKAKRKANLRLVMGGALVVITSLKYAISFFGTL